MTTVIDSLLNAQTNFDTVGRMGAGRHPLFSIASNQLKNAIEALENGMKPDDVLQEGMFEEVKTQPE